MKKNKEKTISVTNVPKIDKVIINLEHNSHAESFNER